MQVHLRTWPLALLAALVAGGCGGSSAPASAPSASPSGPATPTVTISANPQTVASGASSTLTWSSTDATSCTASGAWSGAKATSGSQSTGALTSTSTFSLSCSGAGGGVLQSATVTAGAAVSGHATNFDLTEAPISEGGVWHRANNPWTNVNTANGIAFGTNGAANAFDDSYALLSGFGPNQQASAIVARSSGLNTSVNHEMELLLRFSDSTTTAQGYECLFNAGGGVDIVRWNGPLGNFTVLPLTAGAKGLGRDLGDGEVIKATIVGNVISTYINNVLMAQATDSTYSSGQPGIGFFTRPGGNTANFGMTSYTASTLP